MALTILPSRVGPYEVISRYDNDLAVPEAPTRAADEDDAAWKLRVDAFNAALAAFIRDLSVARETGDYAAVIKPGGQPTRFQMRQIPGDRWQVLHRVGARLSATERASLIVRVAMTGATNWIPGFEVGKPVEHLDDLGKPSGLGRVAPIDVIRAFYAHASGEDADAIITDLGEQIADHRIRNSGN